MNRTEHLQQTLPRNIADNPAGKGFDIEFVVLDYNDKQGMKDWILNDPALAPHLENGTLKYARHPDSPNFRHAHAKNMAHRLATGDVVCNLDADNFLVRGFAQHLAEVFSKEPNAMVLPSMPMLRSSPNEEKGYCGRIALSRDNFIRLGGYDEKFGQWGGEDTDLSIRALAAGVKAAPFDNRDFTRVIAHSHAERVVNTPLPCGRLRKKDCAIQARAYSAWAS
jgi:predicted glycosyltransferase involved in capsule biosynthesis